MKFFLATLFAALAVAAPATLDTRTPIEICPAIDTPMCCQLDALGMVGMTCGSPSNAPNTKKAFINNCKAVGMSAQCCKIPLGGDALLCQSP